jgi:hypothetical protein
MMNDWCVIARNEVYPNTSIVVGPFGSYEEAWRWANEVRGWTENVKWYVSEMSRPEAFKRDE